MGKYSSLVEQIIDEYGDGISPEDLLVILDSIYDVVNIEQIDDELYGLQMQNIVKYNAQENLYKYERDEVNLLLGIGGGEIKLINPDQFMERHGYEIKSPDFIWNKNRLFLERETLKQSMMRVIKNKPEKN